MMLPVKTGWALACLVAGSLPDCDQTTHGQAITNTQTITLVVCLRQDWQRRRSRSAALAGVSIGRSSKMRSICCYSVKMFAGRPVDQKISATNILPCTSNIKQKLRDRQNSCTNNSTLNEIKINRENG